MWSSSVDGRVRAPPLLLNGNRTWGGGNGFGLNEIPVVITLRCHRSVLCCCAIHLDTDGSGLVASDRWEGEGGRDFRRVVPCYNLSAGARLAGYLDGDWRSYSCLLRSLEDDQQLLCSDLQFPYPLGADGNETLGTTRTAIVRSRSSSVFVRLLLFLPQLIVQTSLGPRGRVANAPSRRR